MIEMVRAKKQSLAFCKYTIAGLLWLSVIIDSIALIYLVLGILLASGLIGVHRAPLVTLSDMTLAKWIPTEEIYINRYSMRFAHLFGAGFCVLILITHYFLAPFVPLVLTVMLALLQTIASFGYCSAQKLYECVICNSNCCRFGKKVRSLNKHAG
jgi:hypothetical protein